MSYVAPLSHHCCRSSNVVEVLAAVDCSCGELSRSNAKSASQERRESVRQNDPGYADGVDDLVLMWVSEDLDAVASQYGVPHQDLFEDVLAAIATDTPAFHHSGQDYAHGVRLLLDWFSEDIDSIARSFGLEPVEVLEDVLERIISDTPLADPMLDVGMRTGMRLVSGKV